MAFDSPDVAVIYGDQPRSLVAALLDRLGFESDLPAGGTIGIKPNLILPRSPGSGATTDPRVVDGLVDSCAAGLIGLRADQVEYIGRACALGVGRCTSGLDRFCDGCPPSARGVVDFLLACTAD